MTFKSVMNSPMDFRVPLFNNIVLAGGTTMLRGFDDRLKNELTAKVQATIPINVESPPERKYSVFLGGATYSHDLLTVFDQWITRQDRVRHSVLLQKQQIADPYKRSIKNMAHKFYTAMASNNRKSFKFFQFLVV